MLGKLTASVVESGQKIGALIFPEKWPKHLRPPAFLKFSRILHSFNFILLHYMYMIFMTLLVSVILYGIGGMPYIDALFFAAGSCTQSGLNTIDVNRLYLGQQIVLILTACLCNPIIINTFVVFVRLYWFEKRFQGVVLHARATRGRTIPRRKSEDGLHDVDRLEHGLGEREPSAVASGAQHHLSEKEAALAHDSDQSSPDLKPEDKPENGAAIGNGMAKITSNATNALSPSSSKPFHRDIMFADEVSPTSKDADIANDDRIPEQRTKEQHIAFVQSQRDTKDTPTLWIPGPRDVERGFKPQRIDEEESSDDNEIEGSTGGPIKRQDTEVEPMKETETHIGIGARIKNALGRIKEGDDDAGGLRDRLANRTRSFGRNFSQERRDHELDPLPYLSYAATIGRNSTFVDLTEEQREELGGIEYRALKTLAWILLCYYIGTFCLAFVIMVPWIVRNNQYSGVVREVGQAPAWWGFFTPMSMFTDLGFTLTPDSMISFQRAVLPLLLGVFLIIAGNTGFPCLLRLIIWIASKCVPYGSGIWEELRFLLDHPRRCFTLLFPRKATWWLFAILVILNGVDLIFFIILDLKDETVTSLPGGIQFLDGLFQAASTRTAGFAVVNLADLHPAIQVSYMVMMYISIFPIAISVRKTNVYEEKSLGVYGRMEEADENGDPEKTSYLGNHLRRQLSFDLWYVFLGLFLVTIIEGGRIENVNQPAFTIFSCLFEIVSAYGTVGLSLGYPTINASFSAEFQTLSKLIIIAMMLRGRHRGLPYALDRAILLPSESLQRKEQAMDEARRERRASMASVRPNFNHDAGLMGPRLGEIKTKTDMSRMTLARQKSRSGIKRVLTGALSPGAALKHHHH